MQSNKHIFLCMIYKNYNITYASGFILCLYYMPKLYYKYWQKQELLNPYSKYSKFYTSNNLNTYKRLSPSPFIFEKSFQFIGVSDQIGLSKKQSIFRYGKRRRRIKNSHYIKTRRISLEKR